jgi:hypothetical protein
MNNFTNWKDTLTERYMATAISYIGDPSKCSKLCPLPGAEKCKQQGTMIDCYEKLMQWYLKASQ